MKRKRNCAVIILYNNKKEILLQHRDKNAPRLPNYWALFGGGIDKGESIEEAIHRETLEELNYQLKNPELIMEEKFIGQQNHGIKYVFKEKYNSKKKLTLLEGQGMAWYTIDQALKLKIVDHDKEVLKYIKDKL